jgi:hypothetical protein
MEFKYVAVGVSFEYNGNLYLKISSRTAKLISVNRVFYFGMNDNCNLNIKG